MKPLLAIRCLTYNHKTYIKETLEGFVMQKTTFPFVVIVHDDASTDGTAEIIQEYAIKYPKLIKPIFETENQYSKRDGSLVRIMNEATKSIGAKYFAFCEGDDYWTDPLKLQKQVDFLENNPDYGLCYTEILEYIQKTGKFNGVWGGPGESFDSLIKSNTIPTLTVVLRVAIYFQYLEDIHPETKGWLMGDYPCWLYFAAKSKIKFFDEVTGVYRVLFGSSSHPSKKEQSIKFGISYREIALFYALKSSNQSIIKIAKGNLCWIEFISACYNNHSLARKIGVKQLFSKQNSLLKNLIFLGGIFSPTLVSVLYSRQ